jgi:hypothetical protein
LSFAELVAQARELAASIAAKANARNQFIAVFLPKSRDRVVAFAAIFCTGN